MSIIVTQSLSCEIESSAFLKSKSTYRAAVGMLVLACILHQYCEIRDLDSCPPSSSESRLFICNLRFGLHSDPL